MIATLALYGVVLVALSLYSVILLACFSSRAYRNGYEAAKREQRCAAQGHVRLVK